MLSLFYKILETKIPEDTFITIFKPTKEKQIILIKGKLGQFKLNWNHKNGSLAKKMKETSNELDKENLNIEKNIYKTSDWNFNENKKIQNEAPLIQTEGFLENAEITSCKENNVLNLETKIKEKKNKNHIKKAYIIWTHDTIDSPNLKKRDQIKDNAILKNKDEIKTPRGGRSEQNISELNKQGKLNEKKNDYKNIIGEHQHNLAENTKIKKVLTENKNNEEAGERSKELNKNTNKTKNFMFSSNAKNKRFIYDKQIGKITDAICLRVIPTSTENAYLNLFEKIKKKANFKLGCAFAVDDTKDKRVKPKIETNKESGSTNIILYSENVPNIEPTKIYMGFLLPFKENKKTKAAAEAQQNSAGTVDYTHPYTRDGVGGEDSVFGHNEINTPFEKVLYNSNEDIETYSQIKNQPLAIEKNLTLLSNLSLLRAAAEAGINKQMKNVFLGINQGFSVNLELNGIGFTAKIGEIETTYNKKEIIPKIASRPPALSEISESPSLSSPTTSPLWGGVGGEGRETVAPETPLNHMNKQNKASIIEIKKVVQQIQMQKNLSYHQKGEILKKNASYEKSCNSLLIKIGQLESNAKNWKNKPIFGSEKTNYVKNKTGETIENIKNSLLVDYLINTNNEKNLRNEEKEKSFKKDNNLILRLGNSHNILFPLWKYEVIIKILTLQGQLETLAIFGVSNNTIKKIASEIYLLKKPEPYKGKGIRYDGETFFAKENTKQKKG